MKKFLNVLSIIASLILTLFLTIFIIIFTMILNINNYFGNTNISRIMDSTDISKVIYYADEEFYNNLNNSFKLAGISEDVSKELLNGEKLKSVIASYVVSIYDCIIYDEEVKVITKEELVSVVDEAIDTVNKNTNNSISNKEKGVILDLVSESSELIVSNLPTKEEIIKVIDDEEVILVLRSILSTKFIMELFMVIVLLIGIIALIRWSYYKWITYSASSTFIVGIIYLSLFIISNKIISFIELDSELLKYMANIMVNNLANNFFISSMILFIITVFAFVVLNTIKKSMNKKGEELINETQLQDS